MPRTTFKTNPVALEKLLAECATGGIQLPDFQRSWVWAEDRIVGLIASVSKAFPVGALMTLTTKAGNQAGFAYRPIQGALPEASAAAPDQLLLDGQQRMTSLYQACMRRQVVETITPKNKLVRRWFYIDIRKALEPNADREEAIFGVPEDRKIKSNFDKDVVLDLSEPKREYAALQFPLNCVFDWDDWQDGFGDYWDDSPQRPEMRALFRRFKDEVLDNFKAYQVPVIDLDRETSHEAVCLVFEKVNTGGKALDAFELLTAMYAAKGHKLRDDWLGTPGDVGLQGRLMAFGHPPGQSKGVLEKVASTDVLQAIALLHSKAVRAERAAAGAKESELPAVRATRQSLLDLPLDAYLRYRSAVEEGFKRAGKFLLQQYIYRAVDIPYQTQLVPLAAIFAELGDESEHLGHQQKIARWFWCGIFGELYGAAIESRFAKDVVEVPAWLRGGAEPSTVTQGVFRADRLGEMRSRLSAAYKGIHALLMRYGARDFRTGQKFDLTVYFDESVDIHHIFPEDWCKKQGIEAKTYDTILNKTPLGYRTNRIIGGVAPSKYIEKLEQGKFAAGGVVVDPPILPEVLDEQLASHALDTAVLRADDFGGFLSARRTKLLDLIAQATGHTFATAPLSPDEGTELDAALAHDSGLEAAPE